MYRLYDDTTVSSTMAMSVVGIGVTTYGGSQYMSLVGIGVTTYYDKQYYVYVTGRYRRGIDYGSQYMSVVGNTYTYVVYISDIPIVYTMSISTNNIMYSVSSTHRSSLIRRVGYYI